MCWKDQNFHEVRSASENSDVFNSRDEIYSIFTEKKRVNFLFILYFFGDLRLIEYQCLEPKDKVLFVTEYLDQLSYSYCD